MLMKISKKYLLLLVALFFASSGLLDATNLYAIESKKDFFDNIDLTYKGLEKCSKYVRNKDYEDAFSEYVKFFDNRKDRRYLFTTNDVHETAKLIKEKYPSYVKDIVANADTVCSGTIYIEGNRYHWNNNKITWRDENKEWINVLNRMYYLPNLALAYQFTKNKKYIDGYCNYYLNWVKDNPVPRYKVSLTGGKWDPWLQSYTSPHGPWRALEVGVRTRDVVEAYLMLNNEGVLSIQQKWLFFKNMMEQVLYIQDYLSREAGGNWEANVATGLATITVLTPEWRCSAKLQEYIVKTLNYNVISTFNDDGFQFELTPGYHKWVVDGCAQTEYLFHNLNGIDCLNDTARLKLRNGFNIILRMKKPDNNDPDMGDCVNNITGKAEKYTPDSFFIDGAMLFNDPIYKGLGGDFTTDNYLKYGIKGYKKYLAMPSKDTVLTSDFIPASKLVVMRSGDGIDKENKKSSLYMLFDNSQDGAGSHEHHDYLNIELFAYDKTLIVDPGRGLSYDQPLYVPYYRAVQAHNTIQVGDDNTRQEARHNPADVYNEAWIHNQNFDFARGRMRNYDNADIIRNILFIKGEYWFIIDQVVGNVTKNVKQRFHLLPGDYVVNDGLKMIDTRYPDYSNITIIPFADDLLKFSVESGYLADGWQNVSAPVAVYSKNSALPVAFPVVLYPRKNGTTSPVSKTEVVKRDKDTDYIVDFVDGRKDIITIKSLSSQGGPVSFEFKRIENGVTTKSFNDN
jgi:hypothetical protein